jgi:hypothetical protein
MVTAPPGSKNREQWAWRLTLSRRPASFIKRATRGCHPDPGYLDALLPESYGNAGTAIALFALLMELTNFSISR